MNKIALVIIYNHQFNRNIEVIEKIYKSRFSYIFHLVPFYQGDKENVIAVYENSYFFQGYIAQGLKKYYNEDFSHYIFIADDLILNPLIDENNCIEHFKLDQDSCFITGLLNLHEIEVYWNSVHEALIFNPSVPGTELINLLPTYNEALSLFGYFGLCIKALKYDQLYPRKMFPKKNIYKIEYLKEIINFLKWKINRIVNRNNNYELKYPLVGSYADICIISSNTIMQFCHYCGIFAATNLFVELAIPTAIVLSANKIVTEKNLNLKGKAFWPDGFNRLNGDIKPAQGDFDELSIFDFSLSKLLNNFPKNYIYIHPVKLSKWNVLI